MTKRFDFEIWETRVPSDTRILEFTDGHMHRCGLGYRTEFMRGERVRLFGRKNGQVVAGLVFRYHRTILVDGKRNKLEATIARNEAAGYEVVVVPFGKPAPSDCLEFEFAVSGAREWGPVHLD